MPRGWWESQLPNQGSNPHPPHSKMDSQSLDHRGRPSSELFVLSGTPSSLPFSLEGASAYLSHLFVSVFRARTAPGCRCVLPTLLGKSHQAFRLLFDGSRPLLLKSRWEQFLLGRSIPGEKKDTTLMNIEIESNVFWLKYRLRVQKRHEREGTRSGNVQQNI